MMANNHINELIATDELFQLIQKENFVGWVFSLDYDNALVVTNDAWKYAGKVFHIMLFCLRLRLPQIIMQM